MGKFIIVKNFTGKYKWILYATNGQPIAKSNCYASLAGCYNGIDAVRRNIESEIVEHFIDAD
jgi:uncharacterized protein YegP (UPF0339 family)